MCVYVYLLRADYVTSYQSMATFAYREAGASESINLISGYWNILQLCVSVNSHSKRILTTD